MAEPGSSNEPPRKKVRSEPRKVKLLFKAPGRQSFETWVYDFWLSSSEFFEAKFARWTSGCSGGEPILLELPQECKPEKGGHIFKKRLLAAEIKEEIDWDMVRWWRSAGGDKDVLLTVLCIFDLVMMQHYGQEVVETLCTFGINCPGQIGTIARKYDEGAIFLEDPHDSPEVFEPLEGVSSETFGQLSGRLTQGELDVKPLVHRALIGCPPSQARAFCRCLAGVIYTDSMKLDIKYWVMQHLNRFMVREPVIADDCLRNYLEIWKSTGESPQASTTLDIQKLFVEFASDIIHLLFIETGRRNRPGVAKRSELIAAISSVAMLASPKFEAKRGFERMLRGLSERFRCSIIWPIFAIASKSAQRALLLAMGSDVGQFCRDRVELVHPELRRLLLDYLADLTIEDRSCLATSSFPSFDSGDDSE